MRLVSAGRSITDTMVQRLYREWVQAGAGGLGRYSTPATPTVGVGGFSGWSVR